MLTFKEKPDAEKDIINILHPSVKKWFFSRFKEFSLPQRYGVLEIHSRQNVLISAPTGATKTLTGFLSIINELVDASEKGILEDRVYCVYISPLKALNYDIQHNLKMPLKEIQQIHGKKLNIRVAARTGDTSSSERQKMSKNPPHILITTPESLAILLNSTKFREHLKKVQWVIVDEIHALAENKRGVHLSLSLERLQQLSGRWFCRIGLSATIAPIEEIAKFLVGYEGENLRPCKIINVPFLKDMNIKVLSPAPDLINIPYSQLNHRLYTLLDNLIQSHRTTLIFTNTRSGTERVVHHLKEKFPRNYVEEIKGEPKEEKIDGDISLNGDAASNEGLDEAHHPRSNDADGNVQDEGQHQFAKVNHKAHRADKGEVPYGERQQSQKIKKTEADADPSSSEVLNNSPRSIGAHHGSLSKSHRFELEKRLREGKVKCVVCSTSLELGIDIGYIDLVILLGSPKSVARALQRIGRSGHQLHSITKGRIVVLDRDDLVECSVLLKSAIEKKIDNIHIPTNCADVLAQHIFGICLEQKQNFFEVYELIRRSYCYHNFPEQDYRAVVEYLAGKYVNLEERNIYAKIWFDEKTYEMGRKGKMGKVIYMTNIGTIPEQSGIIVKIGTEAIGSIEEAFLERLRPGDIFVLGGNVYQFKFTRGQVAQVSAAEGKKPTVPSWFSEMLPLSFDLAMEISKFRRLIKERFEAKQKKEEIIKFINQYLYVENDAAEAIYEYIKDQFYYAKVADDKHLVIEYYKDKDMHYAIFHSLFGRRVNDALSRAIAYSLSKTQHIAVEIGITDNGFYLGSAKQVNVRKALELLTPQNLRQVCENAIEKTEVLKRRFRHCAARALMILKEYKGKRKNVGKQQVSSTILMNAVKRISDDFPVLKEARREVLEDLMDIKNSELVIKWINEGKLKIEEVQTSIPSPFAFNLIMQGFSDILKMEDKHEFLKRMYNMVKVKIDLEQNRKYAKTSVSDKIAEQKPINYNELWKKIEKEAEERRNDESEKLKRMVWNLSHVPVFAKIELVRMLDGETNIRKDVLDQLKKHQKNIEKNWPEELRKAIFEKLKEIED